MPKNRKRVLQIASDLIRQDSDGHYIFELPCICYIQMNDGNPIVKLKAGRLETYFVRIVIDLDGQTRREISDIDY